MLADVTVRRCTLTIRRRDGWSWGPGPQPHIDAALAAIEATLEAALTEAGVPPDMDAHLDEPLRLQLAADGVVTAESWMALVERLRASAPDAPAGGGERADDRASAGDGAPAAPGAAAGVDDAGIRGAHTLARTLARWSRSGQMARVASAWPAELVRSWIGAIAAGAPTPATSAGPAAMTAEAVELIAGAVLGPDPPDGAAPSADERQLVLLAAIAAALGERLPDAGTQAHARHCVAARDAGADAVAPAATPPPDAAPPPAATRDAHAPRFAVAAREQIVPALPLLVLAQLARIGYVDAIAGTAAGAGLPLGSGALAAALAGKVLPAPGRGWRRAPAEAAAVVLAAGAPACEPGELAALTPPGDAGADAASELARALAEIAAHEQALVAPLASALLAAYAEGRGAGDELLVQAGDEGILCCEEEGLLPAAWVASEAELGGALTALGGPPTRRDDRPAALARALHERPGLPRLHAPALERQLGAAAGTALGLIALNLWSAAEPAATPLLALERFGDLEARVRCDATGVLASIPRGQRWLDLRRGGLLGLFAVPWLPAGRLEIGTW